MIGCSGRRAVRSPLGRDGGNSMTRMDPRAGVRSTGPSEVRYGLGRRGRFGRRQKNALRFFDFLQPKQAVSCLENPRVDGSIPSLATIPPSGAFQKVPKKSIKPITCNRLQVILVFGVPA